MTGETILIVDDEANIVDLARLYLEQAGFLVESASDGAATLVAIERRSPALLLLDLMLPGIERLEVCRRGRSGSAAPDLSIIILTARDENIDKIVGLEFGADDYMTKPFNPREIAACVRALSRRLTRAARSQAAVRVGDLTIDPVRHEAMPSGQPLALHPKEFDLLHTLLEYRGLVLSRGQLLDRVWGATFAARRARSTPTSRMAQINCRPVRL